MLIWSARRANEVAFDRQHQLVDLVLGQSVAKIAYDQESITVWDDPIIQLRKPVLDFEWLDANVGVWLFTYFGHDQVYVLNAENKPVYAMQNGERVNNATFYDVDLILQPYINEMRRIMVDDPAKGVTDTVLAIELPPMTDITGWNVTAMP